MEFNVELFSPERGLSIPDSAAFLGQEGIALFVLISVKVDFGKDLEEIIQDPVHFHFQKISLPCILMVSQKSQYIFGNLF